MDGNVETAFKVEIATLEAEIMRLRDVETHRDLLQTALDEARTLLNLEREKYARLHDAIEGIVLDMSLMEARIAELSPELP